MCFRELIGAILVLALIVFTGCESTDSASSPPAATPTGNISGRVAILPAQDFSYLPAESAFIYPMVDQQLQHWLDQNKLSVTADEKVQAALASNSGAMLRNLQSSNPKVMTQAVVDFIRELRGSDSVEVLIIPQVMVRSMILDRPYTGASWDGVTRPYVVHGEADTGNQLQVEAAFLVVGIYNRFGQAIYFGRGGVDFLDNATRGGTGLYTSPRQADQIQISAVDEAVRLALQPWLKELNFIPESSSFRVVR